MHQRRHAKQQLVCAILASTVFASPMVHGNTYGPGSTAGPIAATATVDNTIQILDSGQITGAAFGAVLLNQANAQLIIDPNNFFVGADAILGTALASGVNITGANTTTTVGAGSGIHMTAGGTAIFMNGLMPTLTNAGSIIAENGIAITIQNISDPQITQTLGGIIQCNSGGPCITAAPSGNALTLNNGGIIQITESGLNINLSSPFTLINNQWGGQILHNAPGTPLIVGNINVATGGGGDITLDTGSVMAVLSASNGQEQNNIEFFNADVHTMTNNGLINTVPNATAIGIFVNNDTFRLNLIDNGGFISSSAPAIQIGTVNNNRPGNVTTIRNSGTLLAEDATTVAAPTGLGFVYDGLYNTGNLLSTVGNNAIGDFDMLSVFQQDGLLIGNVIIETERSENATSLLTVSGGVFSGDFTAKFAAGTTETFDLTGGAFTGTIVASNYDTIFNLSGTDLNRVVTTDTASNTYNITGGRFSYLNHIGNQNQLNTTINIQDDFTSGVIVHFNDINVVNPGTVFRIEAPILFNGAPPNQGAPPVNEITTDLGTTTILNAPILPFDNADNNLSFDIRINNNGRFVVEGDQNIRISDVLNATIINTGTFAIDSNSSLLLTTGNTGSDFVSKSGSVYEVGIEGTIGQVDYGHIVLFSDLSENSRNPVVDFQAGSTIEPYFQGFLPNNTEMNIFNVNSFGPETSLVEDNSLLIQPPSAVVYFIKSLSTYDQDILLTSFRHTYQSLSSSAATYGVAGALDVLAQGAGPTDPDLFYLLSQLDQLPTQQSLEQAMQSLAPPFNNGIQGGAHLVMKTLFNNVGDRIWDFSYPYRFTQTGRPAEYPWDIFGFNAGDNGNGMGFWLNPIALYADQGSRDNVAGYTAKGLGGIMGVDWQLDNCVLLGFSASYVKMHVADQNLFPKDEAIKSWQGTFYGSFEFQYGIYLDAILGIGTNHYQLNRVIGVNNLNTAEKSSFSGTQWGLQTDIGMIMPSDSMWMMAPFIRFQYLSLQLGEYTESGANDIRLNVQNSDPDNFMAAIGIRFATAVPYGCCDLIPDATVMLGYDLQQDAAPTTAAFVGGGPLFVTPNALPRRTLLDIGIGMNLLTSADTVLTLKYHLELRNKYNANTLNLQYYFPWS